MEILPFFLIGFSALIFFYSDPTVEVPTEGFDEYASSAIFCFASFLHVLFLIMVQATAARARRTTAVVVAFAMLPILVLSGVTSFDGEKADASLYLDAYVLFIAAEIFLFAQLSGAGSPPIAHAVAAGTVVAFLSVKFLAAAVLSSISGAKGRASFYLDAFVLFLVCMALLFVRFWVADSPSSRAQVAPAVTAKFVVVLLFVKCYAATVLFACYRSD